MPTDGPSRYGTLRDVLTLLAKNGVIPNAVAALDDSMQGAGNKLRNSVLAEIPAFAQSGNPEILPSLDAHAREHIAEVRRLFGGGAIGDFEFVKIHARLRAEQRFPLEVMLHAYRCGHRVVSHWLRDCTAKSAPKS